jgi:hypothetical protein
MPITVWNKFSEEREEIFCDICNTNQTWGRLHGVAVSETMLADIRKYYKRLIFDNNEPFYADSFKVINATVLDNEEGEVWDEVEVKILLRGVLEKRYVLLKDLYNY